MKRIVGTMTLLAFVLMGGAPCAAAYMSCGMKMPSAAERCATCATDEGGAQVLRATPCCSVLPGEDRSAAPAVLSASTGSASAPAKAAPAVTPATGDPAAAGPGYSTPSPRESTCPPPSAVRTTVLRL